MREPEPGSYRRLIELAHEEDFGRGDITSAAVTSGEKQACGELVFRQGGVLCGMGVAREVLRYYDEQLTLEATKQDGQTINARATVGVVSGPLQTLLAAERVVLNFMGRLSGIATITAQYVEAVRGTGAQICDTRKTTPGWRELEKYAVRCGGGVNHRHGLYDAVLIKDNHLAGLAGDLTENLKKAVVKVREGQLKPAFVEVEVDRLDQLDRVLQIAGIDMVLLDNMTPDELRQAVRMRDEICGERQVLLEASGGIVLENVRTVAQTGVERISVGALTHTVGSVDIGLDLR